MGSKAANQKPFLDVGDEVVCPHCRLHIAFVMKKIDKGSALKSASFLGPGIRTGAPMKCDRCGMPWFIMQTGQVHLKQGWHPSYQ